MSRISPNFWARPFAHRGLHSEGKAENSLAAIRAALDAEYAIEIDVQPSSDGEAMVFHDYELERLTGEVGRIDQRTASDLSQIPLSGGGGGILTLPKALEIIGGRVPLLIEIKDQSESFVRTDGALERRVCEIVKEAGCVDSCAIMSFNPFSAEHVRDTLPDIARGVVSYDYLHEHDAGVAADYRANLAALRWFEETGADFVSYGAASLPTPRTDALREAGVPVFCWTIRSPAQAAEALKHCDQITFEGYLP